MVASPSIRCVLAPNPSAMTGPGTNTYLVGESDLAVVDPGPDLPEHLRAIQAAAQGGRIAAILVTHRHNDHLPAARPLASLCGAPIYGHADLPGVQQPLVDDQRLAVGNLTFVALATPGHTSESLCYLAEDGRALFCGDLMAGSGTVVVGAGEHDLSLYLGSLRRLRELAPSRVLPGHGPPIEDAVARIDGYLAHRQEREDQILAALSSGPKTVQTLREAIYVGLAEGLHRPAEQNVQTHLYKLHGEDRVVELEGTWQLKAPLPL